ncbi:hypothetical protein EOPP23_20430 [Endozoicomonas sp. OPT23]|uniref:OprD family outer membrane porin n=1 Tax=Endozoicomonas sp. OPT23 TaxID=2072845 RepID=UPI00129ABA36|nr:OprD family outer membrane porin [Endozoicomonas sp. OPT23]MRI35329.1 hypothetical protein [Endozoicomonas sp. OPT23]
MKLAVISATSAAVLLSSVSVFSNADSNEIPAGLPTEHNLSLKLKNYYQDRQKKNFDQKFYTEADGEKRKIKNQNKEKAWGQGIEVNFESGYFGNESAAIGFDFSLYGGLKLIGKDNRSGTGILKEDEVNFVKEKGLYSAKADQSSFGKIGLAHIKAFAGDSNYNVLARAGLIQINKPLLTGESKLIPTTFQGASAEAKLGEVDVYGAWANKVSVHNSDKMEEFSSSKPGKDGRHKDATKIDNIYTVGGSYLHESGIGAGFDYAASTNYLKMYRANLNYTFPIDEDTTLFLEGQYFKAQENGDAWYSKGDSGFDKDAKMYVLNAKLTYDMITAGLTYSKVDAKREGALGFFDYQLASDSGRDFNDVDYATKRQISDFNYNGEKVLQASLGYNFEKLGVPGLNASYSYTRGSDIKASGMKGFDGKYKESEHNLAVSYAFQQKELEGLNVSLQYAQHKADKEISEMKNTDKKGYSFDKTTDLRFIVDYTVSVF